jgi:hypothetical protein
VTDEFTDVKHKLKYVWHAGGVGGQCSLITTSTLGQKPHLKSMLLLRKIMFCVIRDSHRSEGGTSTTLHDVTSHNTVIFMGKLWDRPKHVPITVQHREHNITHAYNLILLIPKIILEHDLNTVQSYSHLHKSPQDPAKHYPSSRWSFKKFH